MKTQHYLSRKEEAMEEKAYELCEFFLKFELKMRQENRLNIARFALRQREKYEKLAFGGQAL